MIETPENHNPSFSFSAIFWGTLTALIILLMLSALTGIIYYFSSLPESTLPWVASAILCISVFGGAVLAVNRVGTKGLYHGLGVSIICFMFVWIIAGLFLPGNIFLTGLTIKLVLTLIAGAAGGVLGINLTS